MRILIVDDEPNAREFMARALTNDGHVVDTASSGDDAWLQLRAARFDWVVVDLRMPGMDGEELHRRTAEVDPEQAGRFIFVTGDTLSPETLAFVDATPESSLMMKPVDLAALRRRLAGR
jgi:two-component system NtrC family sensor kinase